MAGRGPAAASAAGSTGRGVGLFALTRARVVVVAAAWASRCEHCKLYAPEWELSSL